MSLVYALYYIQYIIDLCAFNCEERKACGRAILIVILIVMVALDYLGLNLI